MYSRILVPIDGGDAAQRGLEEAIALARRLNASLVLLNIVEAYPVMIEMVTATTWEQISTGLRDHGQQTLDRAHEAAKVAGVASACYLEDAAASRVCDVIVQTAKAHRCELIVMGTHGRRGLNHAVTGSDAERVVRMSPVPVLLVRAQPPTWPP